MVSLVPMGQKDLVEMETKEHDKSSRDKVYWHLAFFEALQLELHQYLGELNFIYEHQLGKEALRIDVLVIKNELGIKNLYSIKSHRIDVNLRPCNP